MNPEPGFQSGPGDPAGANKMAPCLLLTESSPPSGAQKNGSSFGEAQKKIEEFSFKETRKKSSIVGTSYKPRTPHGTKANTPVLATTTTKRPLTKVT